MSNFTVPRSSISLDGANLLIRSALEHAATLDAQVSIAVVDPGGFLVAFARPDGASASSVQIAIDKAYTAAVTRVATHRWQEIVNDDLPLRFGAAVAVDRLVTFGGGQPILSDGEVVGGIGSSGAHWTGDTAITTEALQRLESDST